MVEDKILLWRFKHGSGEALRRIYTKYGGRMLGVAVALLIDLGDAEDAVHDVFVRLAEAPDRIKIDGNLRGLLATCVANRARDIIRTRARRGAMSLDDVPHPADTGEEGPEGTAILHEGSRQLHRALAEIPYEQREVIVLRIREGLTFRKIADIQQTSISTVQGRYRYGLNNLRSQLTREMHHDPITP
jgi:RNA polymerase sigma-70 factor, ECF subfamily